MQLLGNRWATLSAPTWAGRRVTPRLGPPAFAGRSSSALSSVPGISARVSRPQSLARHNYEYLPDESAPAVIALETVAAVPRMGRVAQT